MQGVGSCHTQDEVGLFYSDLNVVFFFKREAGACSRFSILIFYFSARHKSKWGFSTVRREEQRVTKRNVHINKRKLGV